jgi:hypothetical protein
MAETEPVVNLLPDQVELQPGMSLTPNEMRTLKEKTGRTLNELLGGDLEDMDAAPDRIQSLVWAQLRRLGYDVDWHEAGDVLPVFKETVPDPTSGEPSTSSPDSAASGV